MANYRSQKNNKKANYEDVKARRAERLSKRKNNKKPKPNKISTSNFQTNLKIIS